MTKELVATVSEALAERGLRLTLAESCTGGLLAARLTDRPGASRFLEAGLVAYSNRAKETVLGVDDGTLVAHGAVSEPVARAMLRGARERTGVRAAVAITGVAGPEGGSPDKPVGTVWIGAVVEEAERVERFHFEGDRTAVREASVEAALAMLASLLGVAS